jgi:ABC-type uncharacterized transport system permease subunit|tara:strand:- start:1568 stop:2371 length:804 start_codon:yes stop_codon:yes gene_type:complete
MNAIVLGVLATLFYITGSTLQGVGLKREIPSKRIWVLTSGFAAILFHGISVYGEIFTAAGINMSFFAMASLICCVIATTILLSSLGKPVDNLFIVLFPPAVVAIWLSLLVGTSYTPRSDLEKGIIGHILLSVIAYSVLTIAAFQALLLAFENRQLKQKRSFSLLKALPPLQTMESLLFELLSVGLIVLTLSIFTGFLFLEDMFAQHIVHHTLITLASWVVFVILLWGRYQRGWRGQTAISWTLSGFGLLALGYFGSKLVAEIILQRM